MSDMVMTHLYLLYRSGALATQSAEEAELLQIANTFGDDLSEDEFLWIASESGFVSGIKKDQDFSDWRYVTA